ncbi:MAG: hypothetical protein ACJ71J_06835, partial [Nitrososphaeraceae archaeon]
QNSSCNVELFTSTIKLNIMPTKLPDNVKSLVIQQWLVYIRGIKLLTRSNQVYVVNSVMYTL